MVFAKDYWKHTQATHRLLHGDHVGTGQLQPSHISLRRHRPNHEHWLRRCANPDHTFVHLDQRVANRRSPKMGTQLPCRRKTSDDHRWRQQHQWSDMRLGSQRRSSMGTNHTNLGQRLQHQPIRLPSPRQSPQHHRRNRHRQCHKA
jgi:hypothetical protein